MYDLHFEFTVNSVPKNKGGVWDFKGYYYIWNWWPLLRQREVSIGNPMPPFIVLQGTPYVLTPKRPFVKFYILNKTQMLRNDYFHVLFFLDHGLPFFPKRIFHSNYLFQIRIILWSIDILIDLWSKFDAKELYFRLKILVSWDLCILSLSYFKFDVKNFISDLMLMILFLSIKIKGNLKI